jgi:hypothetical protein
MTNEQFEILAELFYHSTLVMAPGKDVPPGFSTATDRERRAAWTEWLRDRALLRAVDEIAALREELVKYSE